MTRPLYIGDLFGSIDAEDHRVVFPYKHLILRVHLLCMPFVVVRRDALTSIRIPMLWKCFGKCDDGGTYTPVSKHERKPTHMNLND